MFLWVFSLSAPQVTLWPASPPDRLTVCMLVLPRSGARVCRICLSTQELVMGHPGRAGGVSSTLQVQNRLCCHIRASVSRTRAEHHARACSQIIAHAECQGVALDTSCASFKLWEEAGRQGGLRPGCFARVGLVCHLACPACLQRVNGDKSGFPVQVPLLPSGSSRRPQG